jgi:hypothetical protein
MSTAMQPAKPFDRADTDRRVRHPLHAIRGWIRRYVLIEGFALAILYVAVCFWLWLLLDYACWKLFSFDWLYWFTELAEGSHPTIALRGAILAVIVAGLVALLALKLIRRLFKEFSDPAVAMLLERKYPSELGDRLITAVELADPKLAEKYGYSQAMVDATIRDAADRVEKLPVRETFRWGRLNVLVALALAATLGVYVLTGVAWCAWTGGSPGHFFIRFGHTAEIWAERNVLMEDSYWPPNTFVELIRFPGHELRVPREEDRPDVKARAVHWAIASDAGTRGWRAMRFYDLKEVLPSGMGEIDLPVAWGGWIVDLDDLELSVLPGAIPREWGWDGATAGRVRQELGRPEFAEVLDRADMPGQRGAVRESIYRMLDYRNWTIDKIQYQLGLVRAREQPVAKAMKAEHPKAYEQFQAVFAKLAELSSEPSMARTIRAMNEPEEVVALRKSKSGAGVSNCKAVEGRKYLFPLTELKESCQFSIVADDFWTPWKRIALVPPPMIDRLRLDKEEPAYLFYRLDDLQLLKNKRQAIRSVSVSVTGPLSRILVPFGTGVTLIAHSDRKLRDVRVAEPDPKKREEKNSITPPTNVALSKDGQTFTCVFPDVRRFVEFDFEFKDDDGVRGNRRVLIVPIEDQPPRISELVLAASPRIVSATDDAAHGLSSGPRYLITPDAFLKFRGKVEDDHGLTKLQYKYELQEIDFQNLFAEQTEGKTGDPKEPEQKKNMRSAGTDIVVGGLVFGPDPSYAIFASSYYGGIADLVYKGSLPPPPPREGEVALERARQRLTKKFESDVSPADMLRLLSIQPANRKLLLDALELTADKKVLAGFMERLKDANITEGFLREASDFAGVPPRGDERDRFAKLSADDPAEALVQLLRKLKTGQATVAATRELLEKQPEKMIVLKLDLQDEDMYHGFDVRENLRFIKAIGVGTDRAKQKHYALKITIVAADNNVETGPGQTSAGLQYNFLVVGEDELLALMMNDQRLYHDVLKKAVDDLEATRGGLEGQLLDYKGGAPEELGRLMAGLAGRAEAARKSIRDCGITSKAVFSKLDNLLKEMEFNRLKKDRVDKFKDRIVEPLGVLVATNGAFPKLEEQAVGFTKYLSADLTKKEKADAEQRGEDPILLAGLLANKTKHVLAGELTLKEMTEVIIELRKILDVMRRIVSDDELLEAATHIEATQRELDRIVRNYQQEFTRYLFDQLGKSDKR